MSTDYVDLLRRLDDPVRWEQPAGFDRARAVQRFRRFAEEVKSLWDEPVGIETDRQIQDASFHSQVLVPVRAEGYVVVRFSNFGDMVTFSEEVAVPDRLRQMLLELFEKHAYVYVPAGVLDQPYSGGNPGVTGIRDWWIRYFDWV